MMYELEVSNKFKKAMRSKPDHMRNAIKECLRRLAVDPRHNSLHVKKMRGQKGLWEARVDQGNRVTFEFGPDKLIRLINNCNHDMVRRPR